MVGADNKVIFRPVKVGIAGDKYFEVLSGLKERGAHRGWHLPGDPRPQRRYVGAPGEAPGDAGDIGEVACWSPKCPAVTTRA